MKAGMAAALLFVSAQVFVQAQTTSLTYVGMQAIATGTVIGGEEIGGLSGISYNPYTEVFTAITDDSRRAGASRMWNVSLAYDGSGFSAVTVNSSIPIKTEEGGTQPLTDAEGLAGNLDGSFYISHEGLAAGTDPISIPPWIHRIDPLTGIKEAEATLPVKFLPRNASGQAVPPDDATQTSGVRSNLSLECLGLVPSKKMLFTANEAALKQDYNGTYNSDTNQAQNSEIRTVRFTGVPGNPAAAEEKVYRADQGTLFIFVRRFNTVPDILPIDDTGRLLVMERGLSQNNTNTGSYRIRIYEVDFNQTTATNVAGIPALTGSSYTRLNKTLVWESSTNMDNVEALCFGRDVNGFRTVVLASDNNFSASQSTQFHVFLTNIPAVPRRILSVGATGSGTLTAQPSVAWYPDGSEVVLSAVPATYYSFGDWTGDATGTTNPLALTLDANKSLTARFLSPLQTWGTGYFSTDEILEMNWTTSDPDGDGLSNLLEYAFNLNPGQPSLTGIPFIGEDNADLTLTYQKDISKPDISYQVEVSDNLVAWPPAGDVLVLTNGTIETRQANVPVSGGRRFLRLKITKLF